MNERGTRKIRARGIQIKELDTVAAIWNPKKKEEIDEKKIIVFIEKCVLSFEN